MKTTKIAFISITILLSLSACQKKNSAEADAERNPPIATETRAKSVDYYINHFAETEVALDTCQKMLNAEVSLMTAAQKKDFYDTQRGINCRNVEAGYSQGFVKDRMMKQSKIKPLY